MTDRAWKRIYLMFGGIGLSIVLGAFLSALLIQLHVIAVPHVPANPFAFTERAAAGFVLFMGALFFIQRTFDADKK
jgi:hypothetical protein